MDTNPNSDADLRAQLEAAWPERTDAEVDADRSVIDRLHPKSIADLEAILRGIDPSGNYEYRAWLEVMREPDTRGMRHTWHDDLVVNALTIDGIHEHVLGADHKGTRAACVDAAFEVFADWCDAAAAQDAHEAHYGYGYGMEAWV